ncbi:MAG: hypothetical protein V3V55_02480 [Rhodospirillales bacterium]
MTSDIYTDGALNVGLAGGMIRIDFGALSLTKKTDGGKPLLEVQHRLVMTPRGFLRTFGNMERVMKSLVDAKIIDGAAIEEIGEGPAKDTATAFDKKERRSLAADRRKRLAAED